MAPTSELVVAVPVLAWAITGLGLAATFRRAGSTAVLRLSAAFVALWSLMATTALVWTVENGGGSFLVRVARAPATLLAIPEDAAVGYLVLGAIGAFGILVVAFVINQAVGRALLRILVPETIAWPDRLPRPSVLTSLLRYPSEAPAAHSFTLLELWRGLRFPRRREVILVSSGLEKRLTSLEFEAVLAHELGHIHGLDGRYLTYMRTLSRLFRWDPIFALLSRRLTEREEFRADDDAVRLTGHPLALARALYKVAIEPQPRPLRAFPGFLGRDGEAGRREAIVRIRRLLAIAEAAPSPEE
ncbi:MAG: M48 family metalloprotease [Thermoplasmata archaeon]|nr:M48 family metalloprotease [Thermoplasmata archaeon]